VVGGGLAGLAAAASLALRNVSVTLLESRPRWGGRASSFVDQTTGEQIDNCQHVSLGCCTNFQYLMRILSLEQFLRRESQLWFVGHDNEISSFRAWASLPAPLHLLPSFVGLKFLTWRDKYRLAWGLRALAQARPSPACDAEPFSEWLVRHRQTPNTIERFWHVVLVSALSETLDRIDVGHARKVFVDSFLRNHAGWEVWIPTVPLSDLYGDRLIQGLQRAGVKSRLQSGTSHVLLESGRAAGVELRSGEQIRAEHVILAVPHHLVSSLLPASQGELPELANLGRLEDAPISSVHLWFDQTVVPLPHATLIGRLSQWVFNRGLIHLAAEQSVATSAAPRHYIQVVISASRDIAQRSQAEVVSQVVAELADIWPSIRAAKLVHSRVVTEHRATLSVVPGVDHWRPIQQSSIPNVQYAGDWTQTGWPSTMEGAVRSGFLAAENVLKQLGRPEQIVQPDLPTASLSRVLFGI